MIRQRKHVFRDSLRYRQPLAVNKIRLLQNGDRYPICPRCSSMLEREYMHYCDRCGQRLTWQKPRGEKEIPSPIREVNRAGKCNSKR